VSKFILGLLTGAVASVVLAASAASVTGVSGRLMGWAVVRDGTEICSDPKAWATLKEIECD
jgi:hypothetical protein